MNIAVSGSTGLVGSQLLPFLSSAGHDVTRLVRGEAGDDSVSWNPQSGHFNAEVLNGVDAVVHLAGENIAGRRWNSEQKQRIRDSRVTGTRTLCEGLAHMQTPPRVLVSASAIGFYGDRGDELLFESSSPGTGFLADLAADWEAATKPAEEAGIRVVKLRFGVILSPTAGALAKMLLPFKLGVGGVIGSGRQHWSWITLADVVGVIHHALVNEQLVGPVNAVAPNPVSNREFTRVLGRVLIRPTILPLPAFAARLVLGEMANELLLASARVIPQKLSASKYQFQHEYLQDALRHLLGR